MPEFIHNHKDFTSLVKIIGEEKNIEPGLVEKDYWIMHVLHGLKSQGFEFELKGGTSLSKGYRLINRFSEDIDIHIKSLEKYNIDEDPNNCKETNVKNRKMFYDGLATDISIPDIISVTRDTEFDDPKCYRSGGIRLKYDNKFDQVPGIKEGILLEAGFDNVTPNEKITISSWVYDKAQESKVNIIDNRALDIKCYHPGFTLVEKLQTIAKKFRQDQSAKGGKGNFMRQYYDVFCLLESDQVLQFIGTKEYFTHKEKRFNKADFEIPISKNEAFLLSSTEVRADFTKRYKTTSALYYNGQPEFDELINRIAIYIEKL